MSDRSEKIIFNLAYTLDSKMMEGNTYISRCKKSYINFES